MTMIAFACKGDHAEIITDSTSYLRSVAKLAQTTKMVALHHYDAVLLSQGDGMFAGTVKAELLTSGTESEASFDDLLDVAQSLCQQAWAMEDAWRYDSTMFLIGYSLRAEEFVSYAYASEQGFEPVRIEGLFATPSPWSTRPHGIEFDRIKGEFEDKFGDDPDLARFLEAWAVSPDQETPDSITDWVSLAEKIRYERALQPVGKVIVAGKVHYTRLQRDGVLTSTIHRFDDSGEEFAKLVEGTGHPIALAGPCECGSGERFTDCCMEKHLDAPCSCKSGQVWRECCADVAPAVPVTA